MPTSQTLGIWNFGTLEPHSSEFWNHGSLILELGTWHFRALGVNLFWVDSRRSFAGDFKVVLGWGWVMLGGWAGLGCAKLCWVGLGGSQLCWPGLKTVSFLGPPGGLDFGWSSGVAQCGILRQVARIAHGKFGMKCPRKCEPVGFQKANQWAPKI